MKLVVNQLFVTLCQVRWGGTPLQAAVSFGHVDVANMLKSKGGLMPESVGATQLCDAAAKGDVQTLRLLVECAGIQVLLQFCSSIPA